MRRRQCSWVTPWDKEADVDYHVDSILGSDSYPGSLEAPWCTLERVNAQSFLPGDSMQFKRGSLWSGCLNLTWSGTEGNPITYAAYGEGVPPAIRHPGSWEIGKYNCCVDASASWVVLRDLLLHDTHTNAVQLRSGGHNVFAGLEVTNAGGGIELQGDGDNLVTGCHFHDLHTIYDGPTYGWGAVGVTIGSGDRNEICHNRMIDCICPSTSYGTDGGAVELYGTMAGTLIHHNYATGCDGFLEVGSPGGGSVLDTAIYYNVMVANGRVWWLHTSGAYSAIVGRLRLENNTVIETAAAVGDPATLGFRAAPDTDTAIVQNNIIVTSRQVANHDGFAHDHNLYQLVGGGSLGFELGEGEQVGDPLFGDGFRLQENSPARGAGVWLGRILDFDDKQVTDPPDLGAYEFDDGGDDLMSAIEDLRTEAVALRAAADRLDAIADILTAIDTSAQAAVVEAQESLAAAQVVEEAL